MTQKMVLLETHLMKLRLSVASLFSNVAASCFHSMTLTNLWMAVVCALSIPSAAKLLLFPSVSSFFFCGLCFHDHVALGSLLTMMSLAEFHRVLKLMVESTNSSCSNFLYATSYACHDAHVVSSAHSASCACHVDYTYAKARLQDCTAAW